MNVLISVIVPIFNAEKYLDECIQSIINQTYKNLEIILVNDGSTDNSLEICWKYAQRDDRIKLIDKENGGVSTARNSGLNISTGDYIGFVDSDDTVDINMFSELLEILSDGDDGAVLILNTIKKAYLQRENIKVISKKEGLINLFKLHLPASQWAFLYKSTTLKNLRNREDIHFFEDFLFNAEFILRSNSLKLCNKDLYNYRANPESINHQQLNEKHLSCLLIYDKLSNIINFEENPDIHSSAQYFRAHFLISMILSLSKSRFLSRNVFEKYVKILKKSSKIMLKDVNHSIDVPLLYKAIVSMFAINPRVTIKLIQVLKYRIYKTEYLG